ncbi:MAG TPA: ADOP family duplicated permease [Longimicrobiales bacterium]|nr:ADOP family duplicated permease [Longimicrobiales bacterium]
MTPSGDSVSRLRALRDRTGTRLERAGRDVRHAFRMIARMPGLAAVVIVSLGVGIGVNTAIFSWIQAVVLKPIPGVVDAAGFELVEPRTETGAYPELSWLEYRDLAERLRSFRELLAFRMVPLTLGEPGRTERAYGQLVSGNYFSALGLRPALGRFFRPEEVERPGGEPVVVVSYGFWQARLGGSPGALGRTLRVNDRELTVVGVAPPAFQGTVLALSFDLWVPATLAPVLLGGSRELEDRGLRGYAAMGRLRPRVTRAQAQAELAAAMAELARAYPVSNANVTAELVPFGRPPRGPQRMFIGALGILQGVMLLLLLAVCANTANLLLARASARQREIGVRHALGAGPWRILGLLLTENLVLALLGAGLGAVIAVWGTTALRAVPMIGGLPIRFETRVDAAGLAVALLLGVASGLVFGLAPAVQLARVDPQLALRAGARTASRSGARNALMGAQVALALLVLVVAALFLRSFAETRETDPGFRREGVLLAAYDLTGRGADDAAAREFAAGVLRRLRALPGVQSAAIATSVPLDIHGLPSRSFTLEGRARSDGGADEALTNTVTPGYFATMGIPLRAGRDFAELTDATAAPQVIVNEEFVRRYVGAGEPLGRRLESRGRSYAITGVVKNSLYDSFGEPPTPIVYFSFRDRPSAGGQIHLRTRPGTETTLAPEVRRVVRELDASLPVYDVRTLGQHVEKNLFLRRIPARMFVVLGPLLLALAAIGIYAVVAYSVARRTAEIGLRLALGATARRVVTQIVRESMSVVGYGALAGWLLALLVDMHVGRGAIDLSIFLGVPALLLLVATVACWLPARRATRIDPRVALGRE